MWRDWTGDIESFTDRCVYIGEKLFFEASSVYRMIGEKVRHFTRVHYGSATDGHEPVKLAFTSEARRLNERGVCGLHEAFIVDLDSEPCAFERALHDRKWLELSDALVREERHPGHPTSSGTRADLTECTGSKGENRRIDGERRLAGIRH
jgi:hypothetical protein